MQRLLHRPKEQGKAATNPALVGARVLAPLADGSDQLLLLLPLKKKLLLLLLVTTTALPSRGGSNSGHGGATQSSRQGQVSSIDGLGREGTWESSTSAGVVLAAPGGGGGGVACGGSHGARRDHRKPIRSVVARTTLLVLL